MKFISWLFLLAIGAMLPNVPMWFFLGYLATATLGLIHHDDREDCDLYVATLLILVSSLMWFFTLPWMIYETLFQRSA